MTPNNPLATAMAMLRQGVERKRREITSRSAARDELLGGALAREDQAFGSLEQASMVPYDLSGLPQRPAGESAIAAGVALLGQALGARPQVAQGAFQQFEGIRGQRMREAQARKLAEINQTYQNRVGGLQSSARAGLDSAKNMRGLSGDFEAATSRENVAMIGAQSRENVAGQQAQSRLMVQQLRNDQAAANARSQSDASWDRTVPGMFFRARGQFLGMGFSEEEATAKAEEASGISFLQAREALVEAQTADIPAKRAQEARALQLREAAQKQLERYREQTIQIRRGMQQTAQQNADTSRARVNRAPAPISPRRRAEAEVRDLQRIKGTLEDQLQDLARDKAPETAQFRSQEMARIRAELRKTNQEIERKSRELQKLPFDDAPEGAVAQAFQKVGTPYVWGGETKSGLDCSGLICRVFWDNGYQFPDMTANGMWREFDPVAPKDLRDGDLVHFNTDKKTGHVGILRKKNGQWHVIHASTTRKRVIEEPLSNWKRIDGFRRVPERFYKGKK